MSSNSLFTEIRSATHYAPLRNTLRRVIAIMHPTMVIHQNRWTGNPCKWNEKKRHTFTKKQITKWLMNSVEQ